MRKERFYGRRGIYLVAEKTLMLSVKRLGQEIEKSLAI